MRCADRAAELGAGKGAGEHRDQGDADLHGRQEAAGIGEQVERGLGAVPAGARQRPQPGAARRDDRQLGHREQRR